jgi:hypothetical protein
MFDEALAGAVDGTIRAAFLRFIAVRADFLKIPFIGEFLCHLKNHIRGDVHCAGNLRQALHISGLDRF